MMNYIRVRRDVQRNNLNFPDPFQQVIYELKFEGKVIFVSNTSFVLINDKNDMTYMMESRAKYNAFFKHITRTLFFLNKILHPLP